MTHIDDEGSAGATSLGFLKSEYDLSPHLPECAWQLSPATLNGVLPISIVSQDTDGLLKDDGVGGLVKDIREHLERVQAAQFVSMQTWAYHTGADDNLYHYWFQNQMTLLRIADPLSIFSEGTTFQRELVSNGNGGFTTPIPSDDVFNHHIPVGVKGVLPAYNICTPLLLSVDSACTCVRLIAGDLNILEAMFWGIPTMASIAPRWGVMISEWSNDGMMAYHQLKDAGLPLGPARTHRGSNHASVGIETVDIFHWGSRSTSVSDGTTLFISGGVSRRHGHGKYIFAVLDTNILWCLRSPIVLAFDPESAWERPRDAISRIIQTYSTDEEKEAGISLRPSTGLWDMNEQYVFRNLRAPRGVDNKYAHGYIDAVEIEEIPIEELSGFDPEERLPRNEYITAQVKPWLRKGVIYNVLLSGPPHSKMVLLLNFNGRDYILAAQEHLIDHALKSMNLEIVYAEGRKSFTLEHVKDTIFID